MELYPIFWADGIVWPVGSVIDEMCGPAIVKTIRSVLIVLLLNAFGPRVL